MRLIGILVLFFVPESLARKSNGIQDSMRVFQTRKLNPSWMDRLNAANPFHTLRTLVPSDSTLGQSFKRNLVALAIINTVMFGSFMGAMNVMMLYSQVCFHTCSCLVRKFHSNKISTYSAGATKNQAYSFLLSTFSAPSPQFSSSPLLFAYSAAGSPHPPPALIKWTSRSYVSP